MRMKSKSLRIAMLALAMVSASGCSLINLDLKNSFMPILPILSS